MSYLSSTHKRLVLGGVMICLAAAIALLWGALLWGAPPGAHPNSNAAAEIDGAARPPRDARRPPLSGPALEDRPQLPPVDETLIEQILDSDDKLRAFMDHYNMVLPDAASREEYHELLSSLDMMTAMAAALLDPGSGPVAPAESFRRLMQIDYFEAALAWADNPRREKVLELTRDIITTDNFRSDQDRARRQLLGGTKLELYRLLHGQDVRRAEETVALARGTRMESMVNWLAQEDLRLRVREAEIAKETEALQVKVN